MITGTKISDINAALMSLGNTLGCDVSGTQVRPSDMAIAASASVDVLAVYTKATELTNAQKLVTIPTALQGFADNVARAWKVYNFEIQTVNNPSGGFVYYFRATFKE